MLVSVLYLVGLLGGLLGEAFFAVAEIALVVSDKLMFLEQREEEEPGTAPLFRILSDPPMVNQTLLLGSIVSVATSTLFFGLLVFRTVGEIGPVTLVAAALMHGVLVTVFGEMIPRVIAYERPEHTAVWIARPLSYCILALKPVVVFSVGFFHSVRSFFGMRRIEENPFVEDEELEWIRIFGEGSETLRNEELKIIRKIFQFNEIRVEEVLVPLEHVVSISETASVSEAIEQVLATGFTRLPVHRGEKQRLVGLLHALDLIRVENLDGVVADHYRKPFFVNAETLIRDLLTDFQKRKIMMAVVLDAAESACGIVTVEDLLEEIFGEIEDEFDLKEQLYREIGEREFLVDARIGVEELNEKLGLDIPGNGYKTLSGYILHYLRRIPQEGERFSIGNLMFKIELADQRQIYKLFLQKLKFVQTNQSGDSKGAPRPRAARKEQR
jgi:CBS domain containing-hemolysin-like protein